tara:strand:+ start:12782 stop:12964 length:183 start_codon:yes stop_codon:yes gene_type:complete
MKNFIIQEYNRRTKKYRDLGAILANSKDEAMKIFVEQSRWTGTKDLLLHAEDSDSYRIKK